MNEDDLTTGMQELLMDVAKRRYTYDTRLVKLRDPQGEVHKMCKDGIWYEMLEKGGEHVADFFKGWTVA